MTANETAAATQVQEYERMQPYNHTELPSASSIRLVTDLRIDENANWSYIFRGVRYPMPKIICSLITVDMKHSPDYHCLSYTCGMPDRVFNSREQYDYSMQLFDMRMPIVIDGEILFVGRNLFFFLYHAVSCFPKNRHEDFARGTGVVYSGRFWIDAISIHQHDEEEKARQVSMMDEVYSNASVVLSWLGYCNETMDLALKHLLILADIRDADIRKAETISPIHDNLRDFGFEDDQVGLEVYAFFKRSYFRRSWILQEMVLAQRVVVLCGTKMLTFHTLLQAVFVLLRTQWWGSILLYFKSLRETGVGPGIAQLVTPSSLATTRALFGTGPYEPDSEQPFDPLYMLCELAGVRHSFGNAEDQSPFNFLGPPPARPSYKDIFTRYRPLESSDPRDKIFSFLGLRPCGPVPEALRPSYTDDVTVRMTYTSATLFLIQHDKNLDMLCHRECLESANSEGLPSWVPNYAKSPLFSIGDAATVSSDNWSAAGNRSRHTCVSISQGDRLIVQGTLVDTVRKNAYIDISEPECLDPVVELLKHVKLHITTHGETEISFDTSTSAPKVHGHDRDGPAGGDRASQSDTHNDQADTELEKSSRRQTLDGRTNESKATQLDADYENSSMHPTLGNAAGPQTRCEILWRTLLADSIEEVRPAPPGYGETLKYFLAVGLHLLYVAARVEEASHGESSEPVVAEATRTSVLEKARLSAKVLEDMEKQDCDAVQEAVKQCGGRAPAPVAILSGLFDYVACMDEDGDIPPGTSKTKKFEKRTYEIRQQRHLFVTENEGYLGCGPAAVIPGDEVWLLEGAKVPFILRPNKEATGYELIGESYVHSIMYGEAAADDKAKFVPLEIH